VLIKITLHDYKKLNLNWENAIIRKTGRYTTCIDDTQYDTYFDIKI